MGSAISKGRTVTSDHCRWGLRGCAHDPYCRKGLPAKDIRLLDFHLPIPQKPLETSIGFLSSELSPGGGQARPAMFFCALVIFVFDSSRVSTEPP